MGTPHPAQRPRTMGTHPEPFNAMKDELCRQETEAFRFMIHQRVNLFYREFCGNMDLKISYDHLKHVQMLMEFSMDKQDLQARQSQEVSTRDMFR